MKRKVGQRVTFELQNEKMYGYIDHVVEGWYDCDRPYIVESDGVCYLVFESDMVKDAIDWLDCTYPYEKNPGSLL